MKRIQATKNSWLWAWSKYGYRKSIGSLVIILTTRIDLNSIGIIPALFFGLSSFIGNIFRHITDYFF